MAWHELTPDLFLFDGDSCNVYVVRRGTKALVVDGGGGAALDTLADIGVEQVEWVLFTHHHRDQCHGAQRFVDAGAKLAVPWHERVLFEAADSYWQQKRIDDNYNDRSTFFTIPHAVPVARHLVDYETFSWEGIELEIVPIPGHTHGQVALVGDLDAGPVAFTGDLMCEGGTLWQLHAMEYEYGDFAGVHWTATAIDQLRKRNPVRACPSHGAVIDDAAACMDALEARLRALMAHTPYRTSPAGGPELRFSHEVPMAQLSEHLLWCDEGTCSNFFVIRADSGKALLIDYPYFSNSLFGTSLHNGESAFSLRFIEHHLDELRDRWGVTDIDVVIPTHIHDDHVCGIPYLQKHCDTKVWSLDRVAEVLATPGDWNTPCLMPTPIASDRILTDGERFTWEGFDFEIVFYPGQTEFHAAILCENLDDRRVLFAGDSSYPVARYMPGAPGWMVNTVMRNSLTFEMHRRCADQFDRLNADFLCPGHGPVWEIGAEARVEHRDYVEEKEALWRDAVAKPAAVAIDLFWARLHPYRLALSDAGEATIALMLRNSFERRAIFDVRFETPEGVTGSDPQQVELDAGESTQLKFTLSGAPAEGRRLVLAHIDVDGRPQGPVAEALITQELPYGPPADLSCQRC